MKYDCLRNTEMKKLQVDLAADPVKDPVKVSTWNTSVRTAPDKISPFLSSGKQQIPDSQKVRHFTPKLDQ